MTCPTDEVLAAWSAGVLADAERDAVEGHAANCAACRALAVAMAGVTARGASTGIGAEGATVGRYRVTGSLGHGAMGVVMRGYDPVLDREVAIKMVNSGETSSETHARMLREAQTLARIDHPNVVRVHDAGLIGDDVFIAMALIRGPTLTEWLATTPRSAAERVDVLRSVGAGIAALHAEAIVHRDIKPDNILIHDRAGVLVDLGLARTASGATEGLVGTPPYIAPELLTGAVATVHSDQWAWWTVVRDTLREAELSPRSRAALDRAVERGLAAEPTRRFARMADAILALGAAVSPRHPRWRWLVAATAAVIATTLAIGFALRRGGGDECDASIPTGWTSRRPAIGARLVESGADAPRVMAAIDARASRTAAIRAAACHDARAADDGRTRALRRQLCIDETWAETEQVFAGLTDPDRRLVRAAVDELLTILPADRCAGGVIPAIPAPPRSAIANDVASLETVLRAIRFGPERDPAVRLARLRELAERVRKLAYPPLEERWHTDIAGALAASGDTSGERRELELVVALGEAAGDDDARTRALINLLRQSYAAGSRDTKNLEIAAEAAAARLGNPAVTAELRMSIGLARFAGGDPAGALAAMQEASRLFDSIAIDANAQLVTIAQNLAGIQQASNDLAAAKLTYERGYQLARARFGDDDPHTLEIRGARATNTMYMHDAAAARPELAAVAAGLIRTVGHTAALAQVLGYVCEADLELGDPEASRTSCDDALAAAQAAFGANHPQLAWSLALVGRQRIDARVPELAIAPLERALVVTEQATVSPSDRPVAQAYLALALHAARRDPQRATTLAHDAFTVLRGQADAHEVVERLLASFPTLSR